jgi:hypothetical protein
MNYQLAQVNIARMLAPIDSHVMAEFVANLNPINELAERSEGFIWRLKDDSNNATSMKFFEDDMMILNMSVWASMDALFRYVYRTDHLDYVKRRGEWFEKMPEMHMALWYIPAGHVPTATEALERVAYIRQHRDTPYAFTFRKKFTAAEAESFVREN